MTHANPATTPARAPVTVSYEVGTTGKRRSKSFTDAYAAKSFYVAKEKAGRKPTLTGDTSTTVTPDAATKRKIVAKAKAKPTKKKEPVSAPEANPIDAAALTGVSMAETRPYHAGLVIARHGMAAGVTAAMVAELDAA